MNLRRMLKKLCVSKISPTWIQWWHSVSLLVSVSVNSFDVLQVMLRCNSGPMSIKRLFMYQFFFFIQMCLQYMKNYRINCLTEFLEDNSEILRLIFVNIFIIYLSILRIRFAGKRIFLVKSSLTILIVHMVFCRPHHHFLGFLTNIP